MRAFERGRRDLEHLLSGRDRSGERDHPHRRCRYERLTDLVAATEHDVGHAGRQQITDQLEEAQRRERRDLRRLEHERVARCQRRRHLPGRHHQRVVPRRDLRDDADRIAANHRCWPAGTGRRRIHRGTAPRRRRTEHARRWRDLVVQRRRVRFAAVVRSSQRQLLAMRFDAIGDLREHRGAIPGRCAQLGSALSAAATAAARPGPVVRDATERSPRAGSSTGSGARPAPSTSARRSRTSWFACRLLRRSSFAAAGHRFGVPRQRVRAQDRAWSPHHFHHRDYVRGSACRGACPAGSAARSAASALASGGERQDDPSKLSANASMPPASARSRCSAAARSGTSGSRRREIHRRFEQRLRHPPESRDHVVVDDDDAEGGVAARRS